MNMKVLQALPFYYLQELWQYVIVSCNNCTSFIFFHVALTLEIPHSVVKLVCVMSQLW